MAAVTLTVGAAALAASGSRGIVLGRGIDGVQLGQTKDQVRSRLGAPPCGCDSDFWLYGGSGYSRPIVAGVGFGRNGGVDEVFAYGSRTENHLVAAGGVGLGSPLTSVPKAYKTAQCYFVSASRSKSAPEDGRCVIVSRLGQSDADSTFIAGAGDDSVLGAINEVAVDILAAASFETIGVSVSPHTITATSTSQAKLTIVVTSPPFYDFPNGVRIAGDRLTISFNHRGERVSRVSDHGNGTYTATLTGSSSAGVVKIAVSDGAATGHVALAQVAPEASH
jgi:hypothetical protein